LGGLQPWALYFRVPSDESSRKNLQNVVTISRVILPTKVCAQKSLD